MKRKAAPSYVLHQQSGRGRLIWTAAAGVRQQKLLPGPFNSPESLLAKARLELEIATAAAATPARSPADAVSVAEVLAAFLDHAKRHYRPDDGTPTGRTLTEAKRRQLQRRRQALSTTATRPRRTAARRRSDNCNDAVRR